MITYKYLSNTVIEWREQHSADSYSNGNIIQGQTRTRTNEAAEEETYSPWDELLATNPIIEPQDIELVRQGVLDRVSNERDALIESDINYMSTAFKVKQRNIDDMSRTLEAARIIGDPNRTIEWRDINKAGVTMNEEQLRGLFITYMLRNESLIYLARTHENAINALNTIEEFEKYQITWS